MRLIDADALVKEAGKLWEEMPDGEELSKELMKTINRAPIVDAVPVKYGRWMECEDGWGDTHYQCSECGEEWFLEDGTPILNNMYYCPNCGAKMDEPQKEGDSK